MQEHDEFAPCEGFSTFDFACVSDVRDHIELDFQ
jgi:hypothetical protein